MKHLADLQEIELAVMRDIKKRNCQKHPRGCDGCSLFVDCESGLDRAALIIEKSLEMEKRY